MELDDLKNDWSEYDQKLNQRLSLNVEALRKVNLQKSKSELRAPLFYEYSGLLLTSGLMIYTGILTARFWSEFKFSLPGLLGTLLCLVFVILSVMKIWHLSKVNYFGNSVVEVQKEMAAVKKLVFRIKKWELYMAPILSLSVLPILFKGLNNVDLYGHLNILILEVVLIVGLSIPLTIWIYKYLYEKKLKKIDDFLQEIIDYQEKE